ncbi:unnamed protein product [Penicillium roqueforti FM164]|uniref:Genomic scaffold, ProqFM164S01 n=1 Tax=Penicillium roqueforti (strain FM164) TaxID=1365484 RepID=W6Q009_PENRF|nr:unnamed protein product [Penicillium roqueforti FM164]
MQDPHAQPQLISIGTSVKLGIWTILESGVIIIAACLPSIWPLLSRILGRKLVGSSASKEPRSRYSSTPRHTKEPGFSQLGDSTKGAKSPSSLELSQTADSDRYTDEICLVQVSRCRET